MVPASAVGMAPMSRVPAKTLRGPKRSHSGPHMNRTTSVAVSATMLELATSAVVRFKSLLIVIVSSGGKAYLQNV